MKHEYALTEVVLVVIGWPLRMHWCSRNIRRAVHPAGAAWTDFIVSHIVKALAGAQMARGSKYGRRTKSSNGVNVATRRNRIGCGSFEASGCMSNALNKIKAGAAVALVATTTALLPWSAHAAADESMKPGRTLIGLQYETYFTPHNVGNWKTAEAEPVLGNYDSYDTRIMEVHEDWFEQIGVDWLLLDWSNMLGVKDPAWEAHAGATREIEETTELLLRTYHRLEATGRHPPKLVLLLGADVATLDRGDVTRLNDVIEWINTRFLANPDYRNLWLYVQGKPLLTILLNPVAPIEHAKDFGSFVSAAQWTVRWMTSQRQVNRADKAGQWSWMDGSLRQAVSYRDGLAEETVVTPATFEYSALIELFRATKDYDPAHFKGAGGWLAPTAISRDHGAPYIESWRVAFEARPKFIQIHQWNEFAGQEIDQGIGSKHQIYLDEYDPELSDDIEPTILDRGGYRGGRGWGYYYLNLTRALISLYRGDTPDITVLALSGPEGSREQTSPLLQLRWSSIGRAARGYRLDLDGATVANHLEGPRYTLDLTHVSRGPHRVTLTAIGTHTYFNLTSPGLAVRSQKPLPVTSEIDFSYSPMIIGPKSSRNVEFWGK
jgi:hypothetical protein